MTTLLALCFTATRIKDLQITLVEVNEDATHCVQLHPLYANTGLSVDQLYAELVIREDLTSIQRTDTGVLQSVDRARIVENPADIFFKDGKIVRNVYMLGQPAHGKTTFCLRLLKLWCDAMRSRRSLSIWKFGQNMFHFVFYISLRHVDRSRSSVIDMICEDVFERDNENKDVIRHVLGSQNYRILVIVDGLDEWVYSEEVHDTLKQKGLPNTDGLSTNCTVLFASRHWKLELIQPKYSKNDIVVEILGLTDEGLGTIIENILVNFFKLKKNSEKYKAKYTELETQLQNSKHSLKIPMLVTITVFLGYDGVYIQNSMTGLFLDQLDLLIRRAIEYGHIKENQEDDHDVGIKSMLNDNAPKIIKSMSLLSSFIVILYKLGKIAYGDLISKESHLVFSKETLEQILGDRKLYLALKVGVIRDGVD